jgi:hypothetical protein
MATDNTHGNRNAGPCAKADTPAPDLFDEVVTSLRSDHPGDEQGRMLQSPGLKTSGRFYAFATRTHLVVKLPANRVAELIRDGIGLPCDPRGGHPMRHWVRLAPPDPDTAIAYVRDARAFVVRDGRPMPDRESPAPPRSTP